MSRARVRRRLRPRLAALVAVGLAAAVPAPTALAHARPVASNPRAGATVDAAPREVRIRFDDELASAGSTLQLLDGQGRRVAASHRGIDLDDLTHRSMLLRPRKPLADGLYTVRWRAVDDADGDATVGQFGFVVGSGGRALDAARGSPTVPAATGEADGGPSTALFALPAAVLLAALLTLRVRIRSGRG